MKANGAGNIEGETLSDAEMRVVPAAWHQQFVYLENDDRIEIFTAPAVGPSEKPVLFVHGWGLSPRSYAPAVIALAERGLTVIAPSLPGFGESSPLRKGEHPVHGITARIREGLHEAEVPCGVHAIAHSFGCAIAVDLALANPAQIASLTLICPVGGAGSVLTSWTGMASSLRHEVRTSNVSRITDVLPNIRRNPRALLNMALAAKAVDLTAPLRRLADTGVPIHLILADHDGVVPPGRLLEFQHSPNRNVRVTIVHGTHGWLLHHPDLCADCALTDIETRN